MALLIIAIPVTMHFGRTGTLSQVAETQRVKGSNIADEGIAYAMRLLVQSPQHWSNALSGYFPSECPSNDYGPLIQSPAGNRFRLRCDKNLPELHSQQVRVISTAYRGSSTEQWTPVRAMEAYLSRKNMTAILGNTENIDFALEMLNTPVVPSPGGLTVHWGSAICLSSATWSLQNPMNQVMASPSDSHKGFPRKFSQGGITGAGSTPGDPYYRIAFSSDALANTDNEEYWAFASIALPPIVDTTTYVSASSNTIGFATNPGVLGAGFVGPCAAAPCAPGQNCGCYDVSAGDTATFTSAFTVPASNAVIVVNGNAQFDSVAIDMSSGAFIVNGNLSLGPLTTSAGLDMTLRVPERYALEYPGLPTSMIPCAGQSTCSSVTAGIGRIQFRGLLIVNGNLYVNGPGWQLAGAVVVGDFQTGLGRLIVNPPTNNSLTVFYDKTTASLAQTRPLQLKIDKLHETTPH